jgi:uncharacterized membrane-anchored protein
MKTKLFSLVIGLQALWVIGTVCVQEAKLSQGTVVRLETRPVDPRDLLRGDYVILNYEISTLRADLFTGGLTNQPPEGTPVYVKLEQQGEFHQAIEASFNPLQSDDTHPVLRGTATSSWSGLQGTPGNVRVNYGLERFYVHEGTGNPRGKLTVDVAIPSSGKGIIREVYLDGIAYAEAMKRQSP